MILKGEFMKGLRRLFLLIAVIVLMGTTGVRPQTQSKLNHDACDEYKKADEELNKIYSQILTVYRNEAEFIEKLKKAQRAWVTYRDLHLDSVFPLTKPGQYGSVKSMCRCEILADLTYERVELLKEWSEGTEEGNVCAGSIKSKD